MTVDDLVALEFSLLDPAVRRNPERVERLLDPGFRELGASGHAWDRGAIVAAPAADPGPGWTATEVEAREPADGVVLVTYRAAGSLRSSLLASGPDGWRALFHQGTPAA